ncbi:MAG TPA: hypothetical protein VGL10_01235, partial [Gammaproteobacteria bacterium]
MLISGFRKTFYILILMSVTPFTQAAVTYSGTEGVYARIFSSNPEMACISCHDGSGAGGAPVGVNFTTYALATTSDNESRAVVRLTAGSMPPVGFPGLTDDVCGSVNCSTLITGWQSSGFPNTATPEVATSANGALGQTTAVLNGTLQENGTNTFAQFKYWRSAIAEPGSCPVDTTNSGCTATTSPTGTGGNDIDQAYQHTATGLACGTAYTYRAITSGGAQTAASTDTFTTSACSVPVVTVNTVPSYTENAAAVVLDAAITITDADSTQLNQATVDISTNFNSAQDELVYSTINGITGVYSSITGTLTLSGTATLAEYEQALESVTYQNTSDDPTTGAR